MIIQAYNRMMKFSSYNIFVPEKGHVIAFNSFNNSYIAISHSAYDIIQNDDLNKLVEFFPSTYQGMVEQGFIIPCEVDELSIIRAENKREAFSPNVYSLMVYPTQDCNLKCWYCFESHIPNSFMGDDVIQSIINHIQGICSSKKYSTLRLVFFGGEPLLRFNNIALPILEAALKYTKEFSMRFVPFFITNGSLLTDRIIDTLAKFKPLFQITIDGNQQKHDRIRIWKNTNKGTYEQIIKAIKAICRDFENPYNDVKSIITIRINYDNDTLSYIQEIVRDLEGIDNTKVFFHLERVWQTIGQGTIEAKNHFYEALRVLKSSGYSVGYGLFGIKRVSCPAEIDHYAVVNWDGNIYKCNGRTLRVDNSEGKLNIDGNITWDEIKQSKRIALSTFENDMCIECKMLPQCMGPCSQKHIDSKVYNRDLKEYCSMKLLESGLDDYIRTMANLKIQNR